MQLIAREARGAAIGFATIFWSWETLGASRIGVMYDLFVAEASRGNRTGEALIAACPRALPAARRQLTELADRARQRARPAAL